MKNGKAENLDILKTIRGINVPRFVVLRSEMSEKKRMDTIRAFLYSMPHGRTVAIRSSAAQEDSTNASFAGMYATKLRVSATMCDIQAAVEKVRVSEAQKQEVISHYAKARGIASTGEMSVIIQEMIEADMSGVVFSHDPARQDGYYLVSVSIGVESIVRGTTSGRLVRVVRGIHLRSIREKWLWQIIKAMQAIESHYRSANLDVEFAFEDDTLYILQCRPITGAIETTIGVTEKELVIRLEQLNAWIANHFPGDVFGDMIDINPAELLGVSPAPFDISIFNLLFADQVVERTRRKMGYNPLNVGLLRIVAGKPYASLCATAYSFRPLGISNQIYKRLVSVYREALIKNPALQSRVEFDVYAMSCGERLEQVITKAQLNEDEKRIVRNAFAHLEMAISKISKSLTEAFDVFAVNYERRTASIGDAPLSTILEHVVAGTEMFVQVARLAFYWKNKFQETHPQENLDELITGHIQSINSQLQFDLVACRNGIIMREELVHRYGHLRPGQFSIFGESYENDPEHYLFAQMERAEAVGVAKCVHAFENKAEFKNVIMFMQARERIKFLFSISLHLFATKLKQLLTQRGITEREASSASWERLRACLEGASNFEEGVEETTPSVLLPDVIIPGMTDLKVITFSEAMPIYITNTVVKARLCMLGRPDARVDVSNALVLLPNADPGYDFLFHSGVVGIITKVGGPASHMCIRAIELQMPACIGCGERMYQKLASARTATLDCGSQQIIIAD